MLIFLDFDGVLNNTQMNWYADDVKAHAPYIISAENLANFEQLVDSFDDVSIVISSTWRILNDREYFVNRLGPKLGALIAEDWCTKKLNKLRGLEVREYLERHFGYAKVDHLILDDDQDFLWYQPLLHINHKYGLTMGDVHTAINTRAKRVYGICATTEF